MAEFRLNGKRILEAKIAGESFKALVGSMVAYEGDVQFKKTSFGGGEGLLGGMKRRATGEALQLMECQGSGVVHIAHAAHDITLLELRGETLQVESNALLALEAGLSTNITFTGLRGASSGGQGLFTTTVSGTGKVALISDGPAIALEVSPQYPLVVDPQAFVASQGQLQQSFINGISWRNVVGEGNGEPFSLSFNGNGVVYIQPAERGA